MTNKKKLKIEDLHEIHWTGKDDLCSKIGISDQIKEQSILTLIYTPINKEINRIAIQIMTMVIRDDIR